MFRKKAAFLQRFLGLLTAAIVSFKESPPGNRASSLAGFRLSDELDLQSGCCRASSNAHTACCQGTWHADAWTRDCQQY